MFLNFSPFLFHIILLIMVCAFSNTHVSVFSGNLSVYLLCKTCHHWLQDLILDWSFLSSSLSYLYFLRQNVHSLPPILYLQILHDSNSFLSLTTFPFVQLLSSFLFKSIIALPFPSLANLTKSSILVDNLFRFSLLLFICSLNYCFPPYTG